MANRTMTSKSRTTRASRPATRGKAKTATGGTVKRGVNSVRAAASRAARSLRGATDTAARSVRNPKSAARSIKSAARTGVSRLTGTARKASAPKARTRSGSGNRVVA